MKKNPYFYRRTALITNWVGIIYLLEKIFVLCKIPQYYFFLKPHKFILNVRFYCLFHSAILTDFVRRTLSAHVDIRVIKDSFFVFIKRYFWLLRHSAFLRSILALGLSMHSTQKNVLANLNEKISLFWARLQMANLSEVQFLKKKVNDVK